MANFHTSPLPPPGQNPEINKNPSDDGIAHWLVNVPCQEPFQCCQPRATRQQNLLMAASTVLLILEYSADGTRC